MTRADFLVGDANREALVLIDRWPDWPSPMVYLNGPPGSGKSHLVAVWREAAGASMTTAATLNERDLPALVAAGSVAVEDLQEPFDAAALFHLINLARERGTPLLLTSRLPPGELPVALPDLASRLRAANLVTLGPPDEGLLRRVLVKLFADRQLTVDPTVIEYIVVRIERSLGAASAVVEALDRAALAEGRAITRPLAAEAIGLGRGPADGDSDS
jgi:chromosomal replication initiation ATPase DnaA